MFSTRPMLLTCTAVAIAAATGASSIALADPGHSAPAAHAKAHHHHHHYATSGFAFGSKLQVGTTAGSGHTARSRVVCGAKKGSRRTTTGNVNLSALGQVRAVRTHSWNKKIKGGKVRTITRARTGRVSLLANMITAKAITSTATARPRAKHATSGYVRFLGLRIAGQAYPVSPKPNTSVGIPGIAKITLNSQARHTTKNKQTIAVDALKVTLLKGALNTLGSTLGGTPLGSIGLGTTVKLGHATAARHKVRKTTFRGAANGSEISALGLVKSSPTYQTKVPCFGLNGRRVLHRGVGANLPGLLKTGVIRTIAWGHQRGKNAHTSTRASVGKVNLFDGMITVGALRAQATATKHGSKAVGSARGSKVVGLDIAGQKQTAPVTPNSKYAIPGLGTLWLDRVIHSKRGVTVHGLELKLDTATGGLAAGTVIDLANAQAFVRKHTI